MSLSSELCHSSDRLGISWTESTFYIGDLAERYPYLQVTDIGEKGLIYEWNNANPLNQLTVGSRIFCIYSHHGETCQRLSGLLKLDGPLQITFIPKSAL
jgi:hypothetical protein